MIYNTQVISAFQSESLILPKKSHDQRSSNNFLYDQYTTVYSLLITKLYGGTTAGGPKIKPSQSAWKANAFKGRTLKCIFTAEMTLVSVCSECNGAQ